MSLASKLQLKPGQAVAILHRPDDVHLDIPDMAEADPDVAHAVVLFAASGADLEGPEADVVTRAAVQDRLAWVAYPKGGRLGTDLSRDSLAAVFVERGARPVRQIAIDEVWSALRFRRGH